MKERTADILFTTVSEYVRTGEPVSSALLYKKYGFGIKPASIRSELNKLEESGWLSQQHTSGGRVPTDKAYEFFAGQIRGMLLPPREAPPLMNDLARTFLEGDIEDFVAGMADELHALLAAFSFNDGRGSKSGLDELFEQLDVENAEVFRRIAKDFELLDNRMEERAQRIEPDPKGPEVYIGEKSPFMKNEYLATVLDVFPAGESELLLITICPKRSDYRKNLKTYLNLKTAFKEQQNKK